jgi:hypothetical protein
VKEASPKSRGSRPPSGGGLLSRNSGVVLLRSPELFRGSAPEEPQFQRIAGASVGDFSQIRSHPSPRTIADFIRSGIQLGLSADVQELGSPSQPGRRRPYPTSSGIFAPQRHKYPCHENLMRNCPWRAKASLASERLPGGLHSKPIPSKTQCERIVFKLLAVPSSIPTASPTNSIGRTPQQAARKAPGCSP